MTTKGPAATLAQRLPPTWRSALTSWYQAFNRSAPGRRVRWGNTRRAGPFSYHYGYDRGTPVDRYYIETFLASQRPAISGDVLEIRDPGYTRRFGNHATSHVLDIDPGNPAATIVGDLSHPDTLRDQQFDCVILTQTLQFLPDPSAALGHLYDRLRPGGVLLVTVPCTAKIDHEMPQSDFWRWTPSGLRQLLAKTCPRSEIVVGSFGNLTTMLGVALGLAQEEFDAEELKRTEVSFPVIATATVRRLPGGVRRDAVFVPTPAHGLKGEESS